MNIYVLFLVSYNFLVGFYAFDLIQLVKHFLNKTLPAVLQSLNILVR